MCIKKSLLFIGGIAFFLGVFFGAGGNEKSNTSLFSANLISGCAQSQSGDSFVCTTTPASVNGDCSLNSTTNIISLNEGLLFGTCQINGTSVSLYRTIQMTDTGAPLSFQGLSGTLSGGGNNSAGIPMLHVNGSLFEYNSANHTWIPSSSSIEAAPSVYSCSQSSGESLGNSPVCLSSAEVLDPATIPLRVSATEYVFLRQDSSATNWNLYSAKQNSGTWYWSPQYLRTLQIPEQKVNFEVTYSLSDIYSFFPQTYADYSLPPVVELQFAYLNPITGDISLTMNGASHSYAGLEQRLIDESNGRYTVEIVLSDQQWNRLRSASSLPNVWRVQYYDQVSSGSQTSEWVSIHNRSVEFGLGSLVPAQTDSDLLTFNEIYSADPNAASFGAALENVAMALPANANIAASFVYQGHLVFLAQNPDGTWEIFYTFAQEAKLNGLVPFACRNVSLSVLDSVGSVASRFYRGFNGTVMYQVTGTQSSIPSVTWSFDNTQLTLTPSVSSSTTHPVQNLEILDVPESIQSIRLEASANFGGIDCPLTQNFSLGESVSGLPDSIHVYAE